MKKSELIKALQDSIDKDGDDEEVLVYCMDELGGKTLEIKGVIDGGLYNRGDLIANCLILDTTS